MPSQRGDLTLVAAAGETGVLTAPGGVVGDVTGDVTTDTISEATAGNGVDVDGCLIKDGRVEALATAAMFSSTEQTGTGSAQNVAHGLGAVPSLVWFALTELPADLTAGADIAEGTHTTTDLVVTVTTGLKFRAYALK